jgi:hypothetical protein
MEGIEHSLVVASKIGGDLQRAVAAGTRQQNLCPPEGEGIAGAQPGL